MFKQNRIFSAMTDKQFVFRGLLLSTIIFLQCMLGHSFLNAQSPGGVNSHLTLWFKADSGVTQTSGDVSAWAEQSGSGTLIGNSTSLNNSAPLDAIQYKTNSINFHPCLVFDGSFAGELVGTSQSTLGDGATSYFAVAFDQGTGSTQSIISNKIKGLSTRGVDAEYALDASGAIGASVTIASQNHAHIIQGNYTGNSLIGGTMYIDGHLEATSFEKAATSSDTSLEIGGRVTGGFEGSRIFEGQIAEVIQYNSNLAGTSSQDRIVSYLATKYGISLNQSTGQDYKDSQGNSYWTATENSGYETDLFGIGRDDASDLDQRVSTSLNTGSIVTLALDPDFESTNEHVSRSAHTSNLQFLMFGHNGNTTGATTSELTSGFDKRLKREWKIDKSVNFNESIHLQFDGFDENWVLILDDDGDFTAGSTIGSALNSSGVVSNLDLSDGQYFTLMQIDSDNDGISDQHDLDDDNDGIYDSEECVLSDGIFVATEDGNPSDWNEAGTFSFNSGNLGSWTMNSSGVTTVNHSEVSPEGGISLVYTGPSGSEGGYDLLATFDIVSSSLNSQITLYGNADAGAAYSGNSSFVSRFSECTISWSGGLGNATVYDPANQLSQVDGSSLSNGESIQQPTTINNDQLQWYVVLPFGATQLILNASGGANKEGLRFSLEECTDTDSDGLLNHLDTDSDGDGCSDGNEAGFSDVDYDGEVDGTGYNSDGTVEGSDGYMGTDPIVTDPTLISPSCDTDEDGVPPLVDLDDDNDGILDTDEFPDECHEVYVNTSAADLAVYNTVTHNYNILCNTGTVYGDIAISPQGDIYGVTYTVPARLERIDESDCSSTLISTLPSANGNSLSFLPNGTLLIGYAQKTAIDKFDFILGTISGWHDFSIGSPGGDFIFYNEHVYISWFSSGAYSLYEVTVDSNTDYSQHIDLGVIPASHVYGMALNSIGLVGGGNGSMFTISTDSPPSISVLGYSGSDINGLSGRMESNFSISDHDGDGVTNELDRDSDQDGCFDALEAGFTDADADGEVDGTGYNPDGTVAGSDGYTGTDDIVLDATRMALSCDTDNDGVSPAVDLDDDNDGIFDHEECAVAAANLALNASVSMSSEWSGTAGSDVFLNDDDYSYASGVIHTEPVLGSTDWVEYDLGSTENINQVVIYNRSLDCSVCTERLSRNYLLISDTPFPHSTDLSSAKSNAHFVYQLGSTLNDSIIHVPMETSGRYVRLQMSGDNVGPHWNHAISIREMQVFNFELCDSDSDGIFNQLDSDSDGDGCNDASEAGFTEDAISGEVAGSGYSEYGTVINSDGYTGTSSFVTDGEIIVCIDNDLDGIVDAMDIDDDNDGILDTVECLNNSDFDGDGHDNCRDIDSDNDGIPDIIEAQETSSFRPPSGEDTDRDGLDDQYDPDCAPCGSITGFEIIPHDTDQAQDRLPDYLDVDSDEDLALDHVEGWDTDGNGSITATLSGADRDGDGLDNAYDLDVGGLNVKGSDNGRSGPLDFPHSDLFGEPNWRNPGATLPVDLLVFDAEVQANRTVVLKWITATEINNDYFTIWRSADGAEWDSLGNMSGAGNSSTVLEYEMIDEAPLSGLSYYQLQQTDFNGQFAYHNIVGVQLDQGHVIDVYPNPADRYLNVVLNQSANNLIALYDMSSREVVVPIQHLGLTYQLDVSHLQAGMYVLRLGNAYSTETVNVVIQ